MSEKVREEVINVLFAQILKTKGLSLVIPEISGKRRRPDIIVDLYGLRLLIEGRNESLEKSLYKDIRVKLEEGYGDMGMAILYPDKLYFADDIDKLKTKIEKSRFAGSVINWTVEGLKFVKFKKNKVGDIAELIREVLNIYIKNDILYQQILEVQSSIDNIVKNINLPDLWHSDKDLLAKLKWSLGISSNGKKEKD